MLYSYDAQAHVSGDSERETLPSRGSETTRHFVVPIVLTSIIKLWSKRCMSEGANGKSAGHG